VKAAHIFLGGYYALCQVNLGTDEYLKSSDAIQFEEKVDLLLGYGIALPRNSSEVITDAEDVHYVLFPGAFALMRLSASSRIVYLFLSSSKKDSGYWRTGQASCYFTKIETDEYGFSSPPNSKRRQHNKFKC
jgi:hypothetical protein